MLDEALTVTSSLGPIRGHEEGGTRAYLGIPYAHVAERFRSAVPAAPHAGTLEADSFGPRCPQGARTKDGLAEDCLTLNIWVPAGAGSGRPVFFFVHGGSFAGGASSAPDINGADLAEALDAVVVTANYRIGVFGFMDFSALDPSLEANVGIRDVLLALAWVHDHIGDFGGDPENITMGGQSAGATICSTLPVLDPKHQFARRTLLMSAGPTLMSTPEEAAQGAEDFLRLAGTDLEHLKQMPMEQLLSHQLSYISSSGRGAGTYMPVVDGRIIRDYPIAAAVRGDVRPLPMLMGTTREEMSFLFVPPVAKALEITDIMEAGVEAEPQEVRDRISHSYDRYGRRGRALLMSDLVFRMGSVWLAEAMSTQTDVWMYRFDYETPAMKVSKLHAFHSSDLPFLFGNYKQGLAPWMFCFSPSKKRIRQITGEMREDVSTFLRGGPLPWRPCRGEDTPAKCYASRSHVEACVHPEIKAEYKASAFYRRSHAGESNSHAMGPAEGAEEHANMLP